MSRRPVALLVPLLLCAVLLAPFLPQILMPRGKILGFSMADGPSMFYFLHEYAARAWTQGEPPYWNPSIMLGLPFLAEGQSSLFHPLSGLFQILSPGAAMNTAIAMATLFGGLGFYGYLRALHRSRLAAFFGAMAWSFSSATAVRIYAGHLSILFGLPSWPLVFWSWERFRQSRDRRFLALAAIFYACLVLAGHPQCTYIFSLLFLSYALIQSVQARVRRDKREAVGTMTAWAAIVVIGIGISAVQLFPSLIFGGQSFRSRSSYWFCTTFSLAPESLITALCPRFFGHSPTQDPDFYWGRNNFWEMCIYIGVLPLLAAAAGFVAAPRKMRWALGLPAGFFILLAFGKHLPLYRFFYAFVPYFNVFRSPAKHAFVSMFCLAAFAAFGVDAWLDRKSISKESSTDSSKRAKWTTIILGVLLLSCGLAAWATLFSDPASPDSRWRALMHWVSERGETYIDKSFTAQTEAVRESAATALIQIRRAVLLLGLSLAALVFLQGGPKRRRMAPALLMTILLVDFATFLAPFLATFDESVTRYSPEILRLLPPRPYPARYFEPTAFPNLAMRHGLSSIGGYAGNSLRRYNLFVNRTQELPNEMSQASALIRRISSRYRYLGIDFLILMQDSIPPGARVLGRVGQRVVAEFPNSVPRAFLAVAPRRSASSDAALDELVATDHDLQAGPVIETSDPLPDAAPLDPSENVSFTRFSRNEVRLTVQAVRPRMLVLLEAFADGWTVSVNGKEAPIYPANYLFRGTPVPAGSAEVVFRYKPPGLSLGAWTSALAILVTILMLFVSLKAPAHRRQPATS